MGSDYVSYASLLHQMLPLYGTHHQNTVIRNDLLPHNDALMRQFPKILCRENRNGVVVLHNYNEIPR